MLATALIGGGTNGLSSAFHNTGAQLQASGTLFSTGSVTATVLAGAYRYSTTAVATQVMNFIIAGPAARSTFVGTGQPWYVGARFAVSTAITAQTQATVGLCDASNATQANMGVNGGTSTGFFSLVGGGGSPIVTTVAIDTAIHTHRAWRVGGTTFYMVDGSVFTGTADIAANSSVGANLLNGTDAVNRAIDIYWFGAACQGL